MQYGGILPMKSGISVVTDDGRKYFHFVIAFAILSFIASRRTVPFVQRPQSLVS